MGDGLKRARKAARATRQVTECFLCSALATHTAAVGCRSPKPLPRCARHARTCDTCRYVLPNEGPDAGVAVESEKRAYLDSVKTD